MAQLVKNLPTMWRPGFNPWGGKISWRRERLPTPGFWPGEFHLLYNPQDCKESGMTEGMFDVRYFNPIKKYFRLKQPNNT